MIRAHVQIAEIDQCVCDRVRVALFTLDREHLAIALFGPIQVVEQRAGIAEIAERVGQPAPVAAAAVFVHRSFPRFAGMDEIPSVKKNTSPVLVFFSHESESRLPVNVRPWIES
jgi:hypothetical protein